MSFWQFGAAVGGYAKANASDEDAGISTAEAEQLSAFLDQPPVWH